MSRYTNVSDNEYLFKIVGWVEMYEKRIVFQFGIVVSLADLDIASAEGASEKI